MGKNVGIKPSRQRGRPRHVSSSLWHPRDLAVSSVACTGSAGGRTVLRGLDF